MSLENPGALLSQMSVVIVNWNTRELLLQCLNCVAGNACEVIVVDNCSSDGSAAQCASVYPHVKLVKNSHNWGFARACNIGAKLASREYLLFLNPDTLPSPGFLCALLSSLMKHSASIVGPKLVYPDGRVQISCAKLLPTLLSETIRAIMPTKQLLERVGSLPNYVEPRPVEMVSGTSLLISRTVFESLDGWDEQYFMYSEDADLCCRAADQGCLIFFAADISLTHIKGAASNHHFQLKARSFFQSHRSMSLFLSKSQGIYAGLAYRTLLPFYALALIMRKLLS